MIVALIGLGAAAWTPLQDFRAGAVASGFATALAAGDSLALTRLVSPARVADALCAYRTTDVRRWPWQGGNVALRGADLADSMTTYRVAVSDGRSLRVAVTAGWRPRVRGFTLRGASAGDDVSKWRMEGCAAQVMGG